MNTHKDNVFSQSLFILKKDFENTVSSDYSNYCSENSIENKFEQYRQEAKELIKPINNSQKGQVARFIIKRILLDNPEYKPEFINKIITQMSREEIPQDVTLESVHDVEVPIALPVSELSTDLPF